MKPDHHFRRAGRWVEGVGVALLVLALCGVVGPGLALAVRWRDLPPEAVPILVVVVSASAVIAFGALQLVVMGAGAVAIADLRDEARRQTRQLRALRRALAEQQPPSMADRLRREP